MSFFLNLFGLASPPSSSRLTEKPIADAPTENAPATTPESSSAREIRGYVDGFQPPNVLNGWALDDTNPTASLVIEVLVGGQVIATGRTSFRRPDLNWAPDNTAGYWIDTQKIIDPAAFLEEKIEVRADGQPLIIGQHIIENLKA